MSESRVNDAAEYGVEIEPAQVDVNQRHWRAIRVHHRTPAENKSRSELVVDLRDQSRQRVFGGRFRVMHDDDEREVVVDQPSDAPGAVVPLQRGTTYSVIALGLPGESIPSDRVAGIRTDHPDESPGNELFHHSFEVVFRRTTGDRPNGAGDTEDMPKPDDEPAEAQPSSPATLHHYILVGDPGRTQVQALLVMLARALAERDADAVIGFQVEEARYAGSVLILASEDDITAEVEDSLRSDTRTVRRAFPRKWGAVQEAIDSFLGNQ